MATDQSDEEVIVGEAPSDREMFYLHLGQHIHRESLGTLNHSIRHLVTLSAALFAAAVAIHRERVIHPVVMAFCMISLLASLAIAAWGVRPFQRDTDMRRPRDIERSFVEGLQHKRNLVSYSLLAMFLAMGLMFLGLFVGAS